MDRINYAGDSVLTGTEIARALLDYAQALAQFGASATVEFPTVDADGVVVNSEILVGPASQLISTTVDLGMSELTDADLVKRLTAEAQRLRREGPMNSRAMTDDSIPLTEFDGEI